MDYQKHKIIVKIGDINIDQKYFGFKYKIYINDKLNKKGYYESDHVWGNDMDNFRKVLEEGEALKLALEQVE